MSDEATYFENVRPVESVRGRVIRTRWLRHLITFLLVVGPGLIVMEADNDAGAVSTYVQAGAQYVSGDSRCPYPACAAGWNYG